MLGHLSEAVEHLPLEEANKHLHSRHRFEIVDNKSELQGATIEQLAEKFSKWVIDEYRSNCNEEDRPSAEELEAADGYSGGTGYNFFLVVDDVCLETMDEDYGPVVKIVQGGLSGPRWEPYSAEEIEEEGPIQEDSMWEGGVTECEFENVGWMYMEVCDYVVVQERLSDAWNWEDQYLRPPQLRIEDGHGYALVPWRRAKRRLNSEGAEEYEETN